MSYLQTELQQQRTLNSYNKIFFEHYLEFNRFALNNFAIDYFASIFS
jgi:hypothetical protein